MLRLTLVFCAGASLALGQGLEERPAKGLPAPKRTATFSERVAAVFGKGARAPKLIEATSGEWAPEVGESSMLGSLAPDAAGAPDQAEGLPPGASELVRFETPAGELRIRKVVFPTAATALYAGGRATPLSQAAWVEVRGSSFVLIDGPGAAPLRANGLRKLRNAAWTPSGGGLQPAAPWTLVAAIAPDGAFALLSRGSSGPVKESLEQGLEAARAHEADLLSNPDMQFAWLDGAARSTYSILFSGSQLHCEQHTTDRQGAFVSGSSWAWVEGMKALVRVVVERSLPAAPAGVDAADWATAHRKARLGDAGAHTTPVLLTRSARTTREPTSDSPAQAGLTQAVEKGGEQDEDDEDDEDQ